MTDRDKQNKWRTKASQEQPQLFQHMQVYYIHAAGFDELGQTANANHMRKLAHDKELEISALINYSFNPVQKKAVNILLFPRPNIAACAANS